MLVLSRKKGERIRIGEQVVVTVLESTAGAVRLGLEAPADVAILREELLGRPREGPSADGRTSERPRING